MAAAPDEAGTDRRGPKLAPFNPSGDVVIDTAFRLLELGPSDILVDLGCGDARLLVAAASQRGVSRCYGVEYDGAVYRRAVARVAEQDAAVAERVRVRHGDALQAQAEVAAATAIFMYLVPTGMRAIAPQIIAAMRERGVRVVTYMFSLPG